MTPSSHPRLHSSRFAKHVLLRAIAVLALVSALWPAPVARAAGLVVTTTSDEINSDGDCSLREAIEAANTDTAVDACGAGSGADTITFSLPATSAIVLSLGELAVTQDLTVIGAAVPSLALSGNNASRVFNASAPLTLAALTIEQGTSSGNGGGVLSSSSLALNSVIFNNNTAGYDGGGAYATGVITVSGGAFANNQSSHSGALYGDAAVTITGAQFTSNTSGLRGAAVYTTGMLTITSAQFTLNAGGDRGGAVYTTNSASFTDTIFRSNSVAGGEGGGALVEGSAVVDGGLFENNQSLAGGFPSGGGMTVFQNLQLTGTRFIGNTSASYAGALRVSGIATITNALFSRNSAPNGAALNVVGDSQVTHTTFGSPTLNSGTAIFVEGGTVTIQNTVVAGYATGINNTGGTVTEDYNLFFGNTTDIAGSVTSGGHNQTGNPQFWAPPCDVYKLGPGSAAIDSGTNASVSSDFEGDARPLLGGYDIGYDEATSASGDVPVACLTAANNGPTNIGSPTTFSATIGGGTNVVYAWDFGDGQNGAGAAPTHVYPAPGAYVATLTATNSAGSQSATTTVQVNDVPHLGTYPATSLQLSAGATLVPNAAPTNTARMVAIAPPTFKGALAVDPATGAVRVTNAHPAGNYPITVAALSSAGASSSQTLNLAVTTAPVCAAGGFNAATTFFPPTNPLAIAVGDFNEDGKQDMAVASVAASRLSIYLGNGAGGFGAPTPITTGSRPWSVVVNDFNGDGHQDLATADSYGSAASVYLGNGVGGFGAATAFAVGVTPYVVVASDFNHDGKVDLATGNLNYSSNNISLLLGDGTGSFGASTAFNVGARVYNMTVGDFNADGNPDLATTNYDTASTSVLLGDGAGGFSAPTNYTVGNNPTFVGVGDFNEDGKQDLAVSNYGTNNMSILLGNGNGAFAAHTTYSAITRPSGATVGDFNRDGHQDLVTSSTTNRIAVLLGTGTGSFAAPTLFTVGNNSWPPTVGDFNADGKQDLVVPSLSSNTVSLLTANCAPTISDIADQSTGQGVTAGPLSFTVGDAETAPGSLTPSATSSNTALVPVGNIAFGGSGAARTVSVTPAAGASGSATITVQVSDGTATASDSFVLTVNAVNDPPTLSPLSDLNLNEDAPTQTVALSGIDDGDPELNQNLVVTAVSSNPALIPNPAVSYTSPNATGSLSFTPSANGNGTATITVRVTDDGGNTAPDVNFVERTFIVTVASVNDPPLVAANSATVNVNEGASATNSGTSSDPEGASVAVSASVGTITLGTGGAWSWSFTPNDGPANQTVTITADDGAGGLSTTAFQLVVSNLPPAATIGNGGAVNEGSAGGVSISAASDPSAADAAAGFHYAFDFDNNGTFDLGDGSYAGSGAAASATVPATYLNAGPGTLVVRGRIIDKDGGYSDYTTSITIANVAPTVVAPANQSAYSGGSATFALGSFGDPGADDPWQVRVDWGDGSANDVFSVNVAGGLGGRAHSFAAPGTYTVNVSVAEWNGLGANGAASFTVTVTDAPVAPTITSAAPVSGQYGQSYSHSFLATGTPAPGFSLSAGVLPPGLSLSAAGLLSGTPTQAGTFGPLTVTASNGVNPAASQTFALVIARAPLAVQADDKARGFGAANPPLTFTTTGLVNGDTAATALTGALATSAAPTSPIGTYAISQGTLAAANYTITFTPGTLTVANAVLQVVADPQSRTYGAANPSLGYSVTGFINGDTASIMTGALATTALASSNVGAYAITQGNLAAPNYAINYTGATLAITPAPLTVTANDQSRPFGQPNPPLTLSYSGFVNGDDASALDVAPTATTAATPTSPAGSYPISVSGGSDANYQLSYVAGRLVVLPVTQPACTGSQLNSLLSGAGPVITLDGACRYRLSDPSGINGHLLNLRNRHDITIDGNGAIIERDASAGDLGLLAVIDSANVTISNLTLIGGRASGTGSQLSGRGGGVMLYNSTNVRLVGVHFLQNSGTLGGGLSIFGGSTSVESCVFADNIAGGNGAAIFAQGSASVANNTITSAAPNASEAIFAWQDLALRNSIVANHAIALAAAGGSGAPVSEDYNLFSDIGQLQKLYNQGTRIDTGAHSLVAPGIAASFANPAAHDYHLRVGSPAIDRGPSAATALDADGLARPFGNSFVDIGAYEFQGDASLTIRKVGPRWIASNMPFSYQLLVANNGRNALQELQVHDVVPTGAQVVGDLGDGGRFDGSVVRWNIATLAPGEVRTFTYQASAAQDVKSGEYEVVGMSNPALRAVGRAVTSVIKPNIVAQLRNGTQQRFDAQVHGLGFANWRGEGGAPTLSAAAMKALFGPGVCAPLTQGADAQCVLTATAEEQRQSLQHSVEAGRSFGISSASLYLFLGRKLPGGQVLPAELQPGATLAADLVRYPELQAAIALLQAGRQVAPLDNASARITDGGPTALVRFLMANGFDGPDDNDAYTLSVARRDGSGVRALVPYALEQRSSDVYWLYVYDPNQPTGDNLVAIDTAAQTWAYASDGAPVAGYEGGAQTGSIFLRSLARDTSLPRRCMVCASTTSNDGALALTLNGVGRLVITNSAGQRAEVDPATGALINEIPGALIEPRDTEGSVALSPVVSLPRNGVYTVKIIGADAGGTSVGLTITSPGLAASIVSASASMSISIDPLRSTLSYIADVEGGSAPQIALAVEETGGSSYRFGVSGVELSQGSAVTIGFDAATSKLTISDTDAGNNQRYNLAIARIQPDGSSQNVQLADATKGSSAGVVFDFSGWDGVSWPRFTLVPNRIYLPLIVR